MVTTEIGSAQTHLWKREKIPVLKDSCYHDDWWTTRERDFWDWRTEVME